MKMFPCVWVVSGVGVNILFERTFQEGICTPARSDERTGLWQTTFREWLFYARLSSLPSLSNLLLLILFYCMLLTAGGFLTVRAPRVDAGRGRVGERRTSASTSAAWRPRASTRRRRRPHAPPA